MNYKVYLEGEIFHHHHIRTINGNSIKDAKINAKIKYPRCFINKIEEIK